MKSHALYNSRRLIIHARPPKEIKAINNQRLALRCQHIRIPLKLLVYEQLDKVGEMASSQVSYSARFVQKHVMRLEAKGTHKSPHSPF